MRLGSWLEITESDGINFDRLKATLEVPNPSFLSAQSQGFSTAGLHRFDSLYEEGFARGEKVLRVPRALVNLYGRGHDVEDVRCDGYPAEMPLLLRLGPTEERKEDQTQFVDALVRAAKTKTGAVGQASPGYGKTLCSLAVASKLGRTTAVLVHKSFLLEQWLERITQALDIAPSDIGVVQQARCDFRGKKIVLIMAQSLLSSRKYPPDLFTYFGTVMVDEVHRFGAVEFRKVITQFPARYRIGVTATPDRKDGLQEVFFKHIGEIAHVGSVPELKAHVKFVPAKMVVTDSMLRGMTSRRGQGRKVFDLNKVTQYVIDCETRNRQIVKLLYDALKAGRKVLVLSSRLDHLSVLGEMFDEEAVRQHARFSRGYYVGGMSKEDLRITATRPLILATYQMAQEGLDIADLDTLFLATPKGDVHQACGRILRQHDEKRHPIVIDLVEKQIPMSVNLSKKRARQYRELGYIIDK